MSLPYDLRGQTTQAIRVLKAFTEYTFEDEQIAQEALKYAKGLVFMTQIKAGFIWSGSMAAGIVIARMPNGEWSAPSSLGSIGMGFGFQAGAQSVDIILALYHDLAVDAFRGAGQLKLGGDFSVTAGPLGRTASLDARIGTTGVAGCFSYARSHGLFAGVALEGAVLVTRAGDNAAVYGRDVSVGEIFSGQVEPFPEAAELHALVKAFVDGSLPAAGSPADRQAEVETQTDGTGASALEPDS